MIIYLRNEWIERNENNYLGEGGGGVGFEEESALSPINHAG